MSKGDGVTVQKQAAKHKTFRSKPKGKNKKGPEGLWALCSRLSMQDPTSIKVGGGTPPTPFSAHLRARRACSGCEAAAASEASQPALARVERVYKTHITQTNTTYNTN